MADYYDHSQLPWCEYLTAIKTVVINEGVTSIGTIAFWGCSVLESVSIPASVFLIFPYAFKGCSSLTSVSIPVSVVLIGFQAFQGCSSLESVTIPASVKEIQYGAFMDCSNLASVSIEDGVELIENVTFSGCSNLASFNIPASVKNISADAFSGTKWYSDQADGLLYKDNWLLGYKNDAPTGELTIENGTKGIAAGAFSGCTGLTSVSVPASVTSISTQAFYGCSGLTSVSIGNGVMSIEAEAFSGCSALASFSIPASVKNISADAFSGTKWYLDQADGLLYKDNWLLGYKGSKPTGELSIENGTKNIAAKAFRYSSLTTVSIPGSVMAIGEEAFRGCSGLTSISIGDGVKRIEAGAFCGCSALASFSIPASVTTIGESAFESTGWYNSQDDGLLYKDNWLLEYKGDVSGELSIENGTKGIAGGVFSSNTDLTAVSVPASVTSIGEMAFYYCTSLSSIILNSNPFIGKDAFYLTPATATVTMNLTGNEGETGEYWTTFYNENYNFQVPAEGTQVFKAALSGSTLALTELTTDKIITKNNAVILKSTSSPVVLTLTTTDSGNDFTGNSLLGVNDPNGLTADDPSTTYVLNKKNDVVGFYKLKSGKTVGVGKAYLTTSVSAPEFLAFDETTSLSEELRVKSEEFATAPVYNLAGQRVENPTKGLYIVNGKKVVIK